MKFNLDRIGARLKKLYAKRDEILKEIEETEAEYKAEENLEAGEVVRVYKIKPQDLAKLLKNLGNSLPGNDVPEDLLKLFDEPDADVNVETAGDDENDEEDDSDEKETY